MLERAQDIGECCGPKKRHAGDMKDAGPMLRVDGDDVGVLKLGEQLRFAAALALVCSLFHHCPLRPLPAAPAAIACFSPGLATCRSSLFLGSPSSDRHRCRHILLDISDIV